MACPGARHYLLGNTRAVFEASYRDVMRVETPQPPELDEQDDGEDEKPGPDACRDAATTRAVSGAPRKKKAGPGG